MDLKLTEEQQMLRDAVRSLCERLSTVEIVRSLEGDEKGYSEDLWNELVRMDLVGLLVDGPHHVEVAVVCEELGRALAPSPYIETAVFGAALLGTADRTASVAWHEPERSDTEAGIAATLDESTVTGEKILVPFAKSVEQLLVLARSGDEVVVVSVEPGAATAELEGTLAADARYRVLLDHTPGTVVATGWDAFEQAATPTLVAIAAYAVGAATKAHEMSVEYANERIQFDKPIGSYQAMAHALSRMAKYYACDVFRRTAKFGHQVFGGIGFTLDIDIQLFMRRAKQLEVLWLSARRLEEIIAGAELDAEQPLI